MVGVGTGSWPGIASGAAFAQSNVTVYGIVDVGYGYYSDGNDKDANAIHKIDGNQFEPLPAAVRADFQAEIDALYADFVQAVAKQRGMSAEAVIATQAQTYRGAAAVSAR